MFIVIFNHKHLRHNNYFGPFDSYDAAMAWAEKKKDEYWAFYYIESLFPPKS